MTAAFWIWLIAGALTVTVIGALACGQFNRRVRSYYNVPKPKFRETVGEVPAQLTGIVERLFFSFLVAVDASGYAPAMVAWLALKLAASWTWPEFDEKDKPFEARHTAQHTMRKSRIVSMLTGAISMGVAVAAGLLFRRAVACF